MQSDLNETDREPYTPDLEEGPGPSVSVPAEPVTVEIRFPSKEPWYSGVPTSDLGKWYFLGRLNNAVRWLLVRAKAAGCFPWGRPIDFPEGTKCPIAEAEDLISRASEISTSTRGPDAARFLDLLETGYGTWKESMETGWGEWAENVAEHPEDPGVVVSNTEFPFAAIQSHFDGRSEAQAVAFRLGVLIDRVVRQVYFRGRLYDRFECPLLADLDDDPCLNGKIAGLCRLLGLPEAIVVQVAESKAISLEDRVPKMHGLVWKALGETADVEFHGWIRGPLGLRYDRTRKVLGRTGYPQIVDLSSASVLWKVLELYLDAGEQGLSPAVYETRFPGEKGAHRTAKHDLNQKMAVLQVRVGTTFEERQ